MSTLVYVVVAAVVFLFLGAFLCMLGVAMWYMLKMIRELRAAVERLTKSTDELLGEGSFTRISRSVQVLAANVPDMLRGLSEFTRVMRLVFQTAEPKAQVGKTAVDESAFYPGVSDQAAQQNEIQLEAERQKVVISPEQFATMVTDREPID